MANEYVSNVRPVGAATTAACPRNTTRIASSAPCSVSRERHALLVREGARLAARPDETPLTALIREEERALIRRNITAGDWKLLMDTSDGDYVGAAERAGMAVVTVKSRVSRCKRHLHEVLSRAMVG